MYMHTQHMMCVASLHTLIQSPTEICIQSCIIHISVADCMCTQRTRIQCAEASRLQNISGHDTDYTGHNIYGPHLFMEILYQQYRMKIVD